MQKNVPSGTLGNSNCTTETDKCVKERRRGARQRRRTDNGAVAIVGPRTIYVGQGGPHNVDVEGGDFGKDFDDAGNKRNHAVFAYRIEETRTTTCTSRYRSANC